MKRIILFSFLALFSANVFSQTSERIPFQDGEWLEYKFSYSGFLKAGTATLELKETELEGKKVFYAKGFGKTSSVIGWFYKVRDTYESYFGMEDSKPYLFKRNVYEGGHTIKRDIKFDYKKNLATVKDHKHSTTKDFNIGDVQDMISSFYYLRKIDIDTLTAGQEIDLDMFFDFKTFPFRLRFLGRETIRFKGGKIKTLKFQPLVDSGRVFKERESVTMWVSADDNRIPVKIKASLSVGSLRADLKAYKGLTNSFEFIFD